MAKNVIGFSPFFGFLSVLIVISNLVDISSSQVCPDNTYRVRIGDKLTPGSGRFTCKSGGPCTAPCSKAIPEDKLVRSKCHKTNQGRSSVYNCDCCFEKTLLAAKDFCKDGAIKNLGLITRDVAGRGYPGMGQKPLFKTFVGRTSTCSSDAECETKCGADGVVTEGKLLNGASCISTRLPFDIPVDNVIPKISHCMCCLK